MKSSTKKETKLLAADRVGIAILIIAGGLWILAAFTGFFQEAEKAIATVKETIQQKTADKTESSPKIIENTAPEPVHPKQAKEQPAPEFPKVHEEPKTVPVQTADSGGNDDESLNQPQTGENDTALVDQSDEPEVLHQPVEIETKAPEHKPEPPKQALKPHTKSSKDTIIEESLHHNPLEPKGVAFIKAVIQPLDYELNERFWGWRPNDILDFTDNVNKFQLGVLEVTRRTAITLTQDMSRTGNTDSYDVNLENAMNWFMIKSDRYWFPSPESKYRSGLEELKKYMERLKKNEAFFYTRTDNLIPLLIVFRNLLGSCDQNLVKAKESDGSEVSFFKSDDYFYYAKGAANAMYTILEAVYQDFHNTIESRRGLEVLHHAIISCRRAMEIEPFIVTNSNLSGILANHRVNIAAPISHARFYLGVLIKTLST